MCIRDRPRADHVGEAGGQLGTGQLVGQNGGIVAALQRLVAVLGQIVLAAQQLLIELLVFFALLVEQALQLLGACLLYTSRCV